MLEGEKVLVSQLNLCQGGNLFPRRFSEIIT